ncbi:CARDB domain-containing protein [Geitlerinema splendidum]|nr:CARDB domain-containing protein [Geitlerinema splendidum]
MQPPVRPPITPTPPQNLPDLTISKTDNPDPVTIGQTLTYTLTVRNQGNASASGIVVRDTLPPGFNVTNIAGGGGFTGTQQGQVVTFTGGTLAVGASATLTITGTAPATAGSITNTAVVDPDNLIPESNEANNTVSITTTVTTVQVGADDFVVVRAGETVTIPVLDNDPGATQVTTVTQPPAGTAGVATGGEGVTYVNPNPTPANQPDIFTYTNNAGQTQTVQVTVLPADPNVALAGTAQSEILIGRDAPSFDTIAGALNPETIQGGAGNDTLIGGFGADILQGGLGADEFRYNALADSGADPNNPFEPGDTILDFNPLEGDRIRLNFEVAPGRPIALQDIVILEPLLIPPASGSTQGTQSTQISLNVDNTLPNFLPEKFNILVNLAPAGSTYTIQDIREAIVFGAP